ncbi:unnamed protein product [Eruca vesicaria subsp. sativa]|uniref:Aldehyde dehydrogenase domain-containing protein n=1 Tax=Eruca vesicaria subsp. sativa TaxID=29727 RepID=A0ABC8KFS1_ERUVS|nr:unnamed protein product [Eruca vesicaria subsp. sativa]
MAARRVSSLLSQSISIFFSFISLSLSFFQGRKCYNGSNIVPRFGTSSAAEEIITPSVHVFYTQLLIDGNFVDSPSAEGDAEDINRAVKAARKAFDEGPWPKMTAYERSRILLRFADFVEKHSRELAALKTWDNGKTYEQAKTAEIPMLAKLFRYYAGWADKIHGLTVPADGNYHVQTLHEPIGVAGQIIPWNFPLLMFAWKVGPALAFGNTIVLKTAEQIPLTAFYVGKLFLEAGLPPGVLNIVSGFGPTAGASLASHMDLAFIGPTDTGKVILGLAANSNLPFVVFEDADINTVVELAHFLVLEIMFFFIKGKCCCAGSRTYVHEEVYDEFVEKPKARALKRVVGDPFKKGIEQGPQIDSKQFEKVLRYIRSGVESNATLECGGDQIGDKGYFIQLTVFSNVKDDMLIAQDEIFGPVQSILKFRCVGAKTMGLAAGVFTKSLDTTNRVSRALKAGTVWVNCFDAAIPFGGYKMSGNGREKGIYSLKNYLPVKAFVTALNNRAWI